VQSICLSAFKFKFYFRVKDISGYVDSLLEEFSTHSPRKQLFTTPQKGYLTTINVNNAHAGLLFSLRRWRKNALRSLFLRDCEHRVRIFSEQATTIQVRYANKKFFLINEYILFLGKYLGLWLVFAANRERLKRMENRLVCNRFKKNIWYAFFAWRNMFERSILIKCRDFTD
jgi:hypothetical protein